MLAERKQKMKWTPNPCGNFWAKDTSKFGQKMLEKFGWTPGKGLGVNEQGIVNPVRLKCNSTQKGFGYERDNKIVFFKHQEEFSSILSNLNSSSAVDDDKTNRRSLEQSSKACKTRVHYHKFTRGKDLSRYSGKDLSCILGFSTPLDSSTISSDRSSDEIKQTEELDKVYSQDLHNNESVHPVEEVSDETVKQKKKRKWKIRKIKGNAISDETDDCWFSAEVVETCHIRIDEATDDPLIKRKKKEKHNSLTDDNDINLSSVDQFESNPVVNQANFNDDVLSKKVSKKKKKYHIKESFEKDDYETYNDLSTNKICDLKPDKKSNKNKKKHKKL